ncbi:Imm6 family immunity protein [Streptococcus gordonii]|jgi:hypothetical protein|uniref:Imm6 family immunity protein n=1 Tax=Streptococcus gordonii TaxID=1302 RepID=UPI00073C40C8|nr:Imm6 family immunity protein [Streptococcus gordonii]KTF19754.1 hypothetical protein AT460_10255 [Streptococcus gordonii]KXC02483.1 hypothetical protein AWH02_07580 [Streptococcus gordonii]MBZ2150886.1 hypothetical protein [Streptococcus gordonii]QWZ56785.1 hypothetical protein I6L84_05630 [Streptococcus gordonii]SQF28267.1 Uncharacterised protein [Streptococcus gordonii]
MNKYNKALFKLGIAIWLSKSMQGSQFYKQIEEILEVCWKWLENHEVSADDLYFLLDDGTEFGGAFIYMQEDDPKYESRWNCIIEAGASIASLAYECEGKDYKPALLEEIDAEQEEFFNEQLRTIIGNQIQSLDNFKNYLSVDKEKNKEKIIEKLSEILD